MPKTGYRSVDSYIAAQPEQSRPVLELVRRTIRKALPEAEEVISYQIPAYRIDGGRVVFFAGWKRHYSLYPVTPSVIAALGAELEGYEVNHKGTIRFPLLERVPVRLIARIAKLRARENAEYLRRKAARRRSGAASYPG